MTLRERALYSIIESCCFLHESDHKFRRYRSDLGIRPVSDKRPYMFRRKDLELIIVYLIFSKMISDPLIPDECGDEADLQGFFRFHLYYAAAKFHHMDRGRLQQLFLKAVLRFRVVYPSLRKSSLN
jgi:hypothetical protein